MWLKNFRKQMMPDWYVTDLRRVDWYKLIERGIKVVMLDLDNTLAQHGSSSGDEYANNVIAAVKEAGLIPALLTNAHGNRGYQFAEATGIAYEGRAGKPGTSGILKIMQSYQISPDQAVLVGDQIFTDVLAGKRAGVFILLVKPRFQKEIISIKFKRWFETLLIDKRDYDSLEDILR
ncbi:MAG: YqeG family HAD IIIA-type phosphatase [Saccharofermentanales bacterium]|jgi:HAD superfamily phosphatase (TIGR01668 family)|nr:YqeG family HAD IIIA-type phosphatase [Bacillota bacterium]NLB08189.1 YqeG family HAD IIIA-type phosphatase [Clostridiales bacterium]